VTLVTIFAPSAARKKASNISSVHPAAQKLNQPTQKGAGFGAHPFLKDQTESGPFPQLGAD
jgi:hypothetical protein